MKSTIINLEQSVINSPDINLNPIGFYNWGRDNLFPNKMLDLYYNSPTNKLCIDFLVNSLSGKSIYGIANPQESWYSVFRKICLDYAIYGGFSLRVIKNKDDETFSYYHEEFKNVRPTDDYSFYISEDWRNTSKYPPILYKGFNPSQSKREVEYIIWYSKYTCGSPIYPLPYYYAAIKAIQTESELLRYDLKSVLNNFSASGIITLDRVDDEDERNQLIKGIKNMFTGSDNANTILLTFRNNIDSKPIEFTPFDKDISNVNLFSDNNERTVKRILSSHRIPTGNLLGLHLDNTGFSSEASLLATAYQLYVNTTIVPFRNEILDILKHYDINLNVEPLNVVDNELNATK